MKKMSHYSPKECFGFGKVNGLRRIQDLEEFVALVLFNRRKIKIQISIAEAFGFTFLVFLVIIYLTKNIHNHL